MGSALGAGSGADMLQEVLKRKIVEQQVMAQQQQAAATLAENVRQANMQNVIQQAQVGQAQQRIGLDTEKFGEDKRQFNEQAPVRIANVGHLNASTADLQRKPQAELEERAFQSGRDKAQAGYRADADKTEHGYRMGEIGQQGANAMSVARVRAANAAAAATAKTPDQQNDISDSIALVDEILGDDALDASVGPIDSVANSGLMGYVGRARDASGINRFNAKHDQIVGKLKLAQAGKLKGQGPVSDSERAMLAAAATSLSTSESEADYKTELKKIRGQFERMQAPGFGMSTKSQTIRARDPQGNLHEAPAGTALPAGWKQEG